MKTRQKPAKEEKLNFIKMASKRPWVANPDGYGGWNFQGGYLGVIKSDDGTVYNGPASFHSLSGKTREQAEANAELIVRAVNSFEAMREKLRLIRNQSIGSDWTHEQAFNFMRETAKEALAIADGEPQ